MAPDSIIFQNNNMFVFWYIFYHFIGELKKVYMCGIYAKIGADAANTVFEGLKRIEYRGYDSWGVATLKDNKLGIKKKIGKLSGVTENFLDVQIALGHTRWATHGGVTKENAHPHLAKNKSFVLVQNGVFENYQEYKTKLKDQGYNFVSQTDTEVIVGLLENEMKENKEKKLSQRSILSVISKLDGRNTIGVLTIDGKIFAYRNGSPLVVGRNEQNEIFLSSDVLSMSQEAAEYYVVNSGELFTYEDEKLSLFNVKAEKALNLKFIPVDVESHSIDMEGYECFMLKEIHQQAHVLSRVIQGNEENFKKALKMIKTSKQVFTLGSGTASFAAGNTAYLLRKLGLNASSIAAYEADSFRPLFNSDSVCIVFSQSGETADTNEVVEWMKEKGVKIISVVNMQGSTLTQLSNLSFMLHVGPELAVASTKAFFGHMLWGMIIERLICGNELRGIKKKILYFEDKLKLWFDNELVQTKIRNIADSLVKKNHLFVLGRGDLYYPSLESALKLKEISYIHAEGFSGGELKHGVIALIEKNTPVLCLVADDENKSNMHNAIAEVKARGGRTIVVAREDNELYSDWIQLPETDGFISLSSIIPSQLLTCYMALEKGFDADKPRNLAKSVTVK